MRPDGTWTCTETTARWGIESPAKIRRGENGEVVYWHEIFTQMLGFAVYNLGVSNDQNRDRRKTRGIAERKVKARNCPFAQ